MQPQPPDDGDLLQPSSQPPSSTASGEVAISRRAVLGGAVVAAVVGASAAAARTGATATSGAAAQSGAAPTAPQSAPGRAVAAGAVQKRMPTLYLPHGGGPCFFMEWTMGPRDTWDAMAAWLRALPASLPERPKALLVVSAHWETRRPTLLTGAQPPLLFDYYGFPEHTYQLRWPAPGAPALAGQVAQLLRGAGIETDVDSSRGFDHGVFVPLLLAFPQADVPTLQLSLQAGLDPAQHLAIGRALAPLRDEGVLIIGSGMSYHNMGGFGRERSLADSLAFDAWLEQTAKAEPVERSRRLERWAEAPAARACHPREEHLLPLMVCAGAGLQDAGRVAFRDQVMAVQVSALQFG